MKTRSWQHFSTERRLAEVRRNRFEMRAYAMSFREQIAPDNAIFGTHAERVRYAALNLSHAIFYRDLANRTAARNWS